MSDITLRSQEGCFNFRAAAIIIHGNKLLVAKDTKYPCYYIPGGRVHLHETAQEAAVRETFEETGILCEVDRLLYVQERFFTLDDVDYHELAMYYRMQYSGDSAIMENSPTDHPQAESLHWLPMDRLDDYRIVPEFIKHKPLDIQQAEHIVEDGRQK